MPDRARLTKNQQAVLSKLAKSDIGLIIREFADIATVSQGRRVWANSILRALEEKGLTQKTPEKRSNGTYVWIITAAGRKALETPATTDTTDAALTAIQIQTLRGIADAHPWPDERVSGRKTHNALERRGLIKVIEKWTGWRQIRLTKKGIDVANKLLGTSLTQPENPEEYTLD